jgi:hypothetical protein
MLQSLNVSCSVRLARNEGRGTTKYMKEKSNKERERRDTISGGVKSPLSGGETCLAWNDLVCGVVLVLKDVTFAHETPLATGKKKKG